VGGRWHGSATAQSNFVPDVSGNRRYSFNQTYSWGFNQDSTIATKIATFRDEARSYYSADQRLMAHRFRRDTVDASDPTDTLGVSSGAYDEFWYDALGRRVLKRSYQDGDVCDIPSRCFSSIERLVWDGNQLLWELRQAAPATRRWGARSATYMPPASTRRSAW